MSYRKRNLTGKQAAVIFIVSFLLFAEIFLSMNLKEEMLILIAKATGCAVLVTLLITAFWRLIVRTFLFVFSKEYRYSKKKNH